MGNKILTFNNNKKKIQIVMLGLDGAGKTTILYRLKLNRNVFKTKPTTAFNVDTIKPIKNIKFLIWDTAGSEKLRPLWRTYIRKADGLIYVIDSADTARFEEVKVELENILAFKEAEGIPLMILANKQDKKYAESAIDLSRDLELDHLDYSVKWFLHPTSGRYGDGLEDAMLQLSKMVDENKNMAKWRERRQKSMSTNTLNLFERTENSAFI